MNFDIAVNGRAWSVAVEVSERPGAFNVSIGDRTRIVDASWIDADTLSLIDGGASREARVHQRDEGVLDIAVHGRAFVAVVSKVGRASFSDQRRAGLGVQDAPYLSKSVGAHATRAPMPGRVVRLLVAAGETVSAGQPVVIVEAMKMENELRSSGTGVVKEINVQEGQAIDTGAVLLVIEYAASL